MVDNIFTFNADKKEWGLSRSQLSQAIIESLELDDITSEILINLFKTAEEWKQYLYDLNHEYIEPSCRDKELTAEFLKELSQQAIGTFKECITYNASEESTFTFNTDTAFKAYRAAREVQGLPDPFVASITPADMHRQAKNLSLKEKNKQKLVIEPTHWLNEQDFSDILAACGIVKNSVKIIALNSLTDSLKGLTGKENATVPLLINANDNHWLQAIVTVKNDTIDIAIRDSGETYGARQELERAFKKAFTGKTIKFRYPRTEQQPDAWSCGYRAVTSLLQDLKVKATPAITALYKAKSSQTLRDAVFKLLGVSLANKTAATEIIPLTTVTSIFTNKSDVKRDFLKDQLDAWKGSLEKTLASPCKTIATADKTNDMEVYEGETDEAYATRLQIAEIDLYLSHHRKSR